MIPYAPSLNGLNPKLRVQTVAQPCYAEPQGVISQQQRKYIANDMTCQREFPVNAATWPSP